MSDHPEPKLPDDATLIARALDGCRSSFGDLVGKYQDRLYNSLVHFLGNATEAEDVAQEAFVLAFTRLEMFRGDSAFYTWLYRIAVNSAISLRRKKRPSLASDNAARADSGNNLDDTTHELPEDPMIQQESVALVHRALAELSEEHREILVLRELEGYDYDGISEMCGIPVGTVRSRLHRARGQLKIELERIEDKSRLQTRTD